MTDQTFYGIAGAIILMLGTFVAGHQGFALTHPLLIIFRETYRFIRAARRVVHQAADYVKHGKSRLKLHNDGIKSKAYIAFGIGIACTIAAYVMKWTFNTIGIVDSEKYLYPLLIIALLGLIVSMLYLTISMFLDILSNFLGGILTALEVLEIVHSAVRDGLRDFLEITVSLPEKQVSLLLSWVGGAMIVIGTASVVRSFL